MATIYVNEAGVADPTKPVRSALALREPIPAPGPGPAAAPKPSIGQRAFSLGRVVGDAARSPAGRAASRGLGAAAVLPHFNDYKINDPENDSSAAGTFDALKRGDFAGAGRSASKGMLELGLDLGSAVANTLDYITPGKAPVSSAYNTAVRDKFSDKAAGMMGVPDQLVDNSGDGPVDYGPGAGRGSVNPANVKPDADVFTMQPYLGNPGLGGPARPAGPTGEMKGPGVSVVPSFKDWEGQAERVRGINASMAETQRGLDAYGPGPHGGGYGGIGKTQAEIARDNTRRGLEFTVGSRMAEDSDRAQARAQLGAMDAQDSAERAQSARLAGESATELAKTSLAGRNALAVQGLRNQGDLATEGLRAANNPAMFKAMLDAQRRGLAAQVLSRSNGDYASAAKAAASIGDADMAKTFLELAGSADKSTDDRRASLHKQLEAYARDPATGKVDEAKLATMLQQADRIGTDTAQLSAMDAGRRSQALNALSGEARVRTGLRREPSWFGADPLPVDPTNIELQGGTPEDLGFLENLVTKGTKTGDTKITLRNGSKVYLPREQMLESDRRRIEEMTGKNYR